MRSILIVKLILLSLIVNLPVTPPAPVDSHPHEVFVTTSPCDAASKSLLKIPATADCEIIKWSLTLHHDPDTPTSATYKLTYAYGLPKQGTNEIAQGGIKVEQKGRWAMTKGAKTSPDAVVYRLDPDKSQESISFQKVDDHLLHLLNRDKSLMVGNAGWSYTLSRTESYTGHMQQASPSAVSRVTSGSSPAAALSEKNASAIQGAFVGRSPCREIARELNRAVEADCMKLKWGLTLYHDPNTQLPTTYKLNGTLYRKRIGEGRWAIIKGTKTNPDAVVYQLDLDNPQSSLFLLKADDNILFFLDKEKNLLSGNDNFSYTLNRTNEVLKY